MEQQQKWSQATTSVERTLYTQRIVRCDYNRKSLQLSRSQWSWELVDKRSGPARSGREGCSVPSVGMESGREWILGRSWRLPYSVKLAGSLGLVCPGSPLLCQRNDGAPHHRHRSSEDAEGSSCANGSSSRSSTSRTDLHGIELARRVKHTSQSSAESSAVLCYGCCYYWPAVAERGKPSTKRPCWVSRRASYGSKAGWQAVALPLRPPGSPPF